MKESNSVYMTMAFAGVALMAAMIVGVVVIRRRNGRHPHHQVKHRNVLNVAIAVDASLKAHLVLTQNELITPS
jgi:hypothetical protein